VKNQLVRNILAALQEFVLKEYLVRRVAAGREAHRPIDGPEDPARNQRSSRLKIANAPGQDGLLARKQPATSAKMPSKKAACHIHDPSSCSSSSNSKISGAAKNQSQRLAARRNF